MLSHSQLYSLIFAQPLDPPLSGVIHRGVRCSPASAQIVLKPHCTRRDICSSTICNTPNYRLLNESLTTTLHTVTLHSTSLLIRTFHQSELSIGNPFWDLNNLFQLISRSMIVPKNQHDTFQSILSLLTRFLKTYQKVTHPITTPSQACLTMEFLSDGLPKSRCILLV